VETLDRVGCGLTKRGWRPALEKKRIDESLLKHRPGSVGRIKTGAVLYHSRDLASTSARAMDDVCLSWALRSFSYVSSKSGPPRWYCIKVLQVRRTLCTRADIRNRRSIWCTQLYHPNIHTSPLRTESSDVLVKARSAVLQSEA
jgi:hypothetical protein